MSDLNNSFFNIYFKLSVCYLCVGMCMRVLVPMEAGGACWMPWSWS